MLIDETLPAVMPRKRDIAGRFAFGLLVVLAVVDALVPRVTISILFAIPLVLLARAGYVRPLWRWTLAFVVLTYGLYFIKYGLWPPEEGPRYFDYRLVNRTFVAVMYWLLPVFFEIWREGDTYSHEALHEGTYDPLDSEVETTMGMLIGVPLAMLIALVDIFLPGHLNIPVLYPIPQLAFALTNNRKVLWGATAMLVLLTYVGHVLGPEGQAAETYIVANRLLAAVLLVCLASIMDVWMRDSKV